MVDPPVDISTFEIVFDPNGGINPEKQSDDMNFEVTVDQLLALLHTSGSNVRALDEIIDQPVAVLLKGMTISDIADFINDPEIDFAQIVKQSKPTPPGRNLNYEIVLHGLITFLLSYLFY